MTKAEDFIEEWAEGFDRSVRRGQEMNSLLGLVRNEVARQDAKWGDQDHPNYEAGYTWLHQGRYLSEARRWKAMNDLRMKLGKPATWDAILLEEVYEALAEPDEDLREVELMQVAAVAVNMARNLRRNKSKPSVEVSASGRTTFTAAGYVRAGESACTCCDPYEAA